MSYPGLAHDDHRILGDDYCPGYVDIYGKWNTGFFCPPTSPTTPVFCCGTTYYKYCCVERPDSLNQRAGGGPNDGDMDVDLLLDSSSSNEDGIIKDHSHSSRTGSGSASYSTTTVHTVEVPLFFAIFCGVFIVALFLATAIYFFCSCCVVYKKRRSQEVGEGEEGALGLPFSGLYHIAPLPPGNAGVPAGLLTTPLDHHLQYTTIPILSPTSSSSSSGYPSSISSSGLRETSNHQQGNLLWWRNPRNNGVSSSSYNYYLNNNSLAGGGRRPNGASTSPSVSSISSSVLPLPQNPNLNVGFGYRPPSSLSTVSSSAYSSNAWGTPPPPYSVRPSQEEIDATVLSLLQLHQHQRNSGISNNNNSYHHQVPPNTRNTTNNNNSVLLNDNTRRQGMMIRPSPPQPQPEGTLSLTAITLQSLINTYLATNSNSNQRNNNNNMNITNPLEDPINPNVIINLLLSSVLNNQNQNQLRLRESVNISGAIRDSSGESPANNNDGGMRNTSPGISQSDCSDCGIGESSSEPSTKIMKEEREICGESSNSESKRESCSTSTSGNGNESGNCDDDDDDTNKEKVENPNFPTRQREMIQIIETSEEISVPLDVLDEEKDCTSCFDVEEDHEENKIKKTEQDYISSLMEETKILKTQEDVEEQGETDFSPTSTSSKLSLQHNLTSNMDMELEDKLNDNFNIKEGSNTQKDLMEEAAR